MKSNPRYLILVSVVFLFGCAAGVRTSVTKPFLTNISEWSQQFQKNYDRIQSFQGNARLTVESPQLSGHLSVEIYWIRPDTLYIQAGGPLGMDIGEMFLGRSRFIIHNQYENQFMAGDLDDPYMGKFLQTDIYLKDLKQAVLGRPLHLSSPLKLTDREGGVFRSQKGGGEYRYVVNPRTGLLESWEKLENGQVQVLQEFKNYHEIDGVYIPYLIQLTLPAEQQRISIFYKDVEINKPIDSGIYTIEIGPKVKQINLN